VIAEISLSSREQSEASSRSTTPSATWMKRPSRTRRWWSRLLQRPRR
jgi:hypothetical protein